MPARTSTLGALRFGHRAVPLERRERIAACASSARGRDLVVLVTCHRVELYSVVPRGVEPREWFARRLAPLGVPTGEGVALAGPRAARHLIRVAAGLDSALKGERQILGQLRRVHDEARAAPLDPLLALALRAALRFGRELRATMPLGAADGSLGSVAVDFVARALASPASSTVLVVGAGEVGRLAVRALASRVGRVLVANRDPERARALATERVRPIALGDVRAALAHADAVISAADTRGAVLDAAALRQRLARGPLVLVDLAFPRSVAEGARRLEGLVYRSVDDLVVAEAAADRDALARAEARAAAAAAALLEEWREREAAGTIAALRARAERIRAAQLARALARLGHLSERDRGVVSGLAEGLVSALLHAPTVALRADPTRQESARSLFALDDR